VNQLVKLYELKKGDKFYNTHGDNLIYVLHGCEVDMENPHKIKWWGKIFKMGRYEQPETHQMCGFGVRDLEYYKYTGRDHSSFLAGFRAAAKICNNHMGSIDKENAGIDTPWTQHLTMLNAFREWKKNFYEEL
jgi:hypothetical protein